MQIAEYTAEDRDTVEDVVEINNAFARVEAPWSHPSTASIWIAMTLHGWDGEAPRRFVARERGRVVGHGSFWASEWDNTDLAWLDVVVHPDHRRRGVGRALLTHLLDLAREAGRTKVGIDGWDTPSTAAFALAHGFGKKSQAVNRRQYLAEVDRALVAKLDAEAADASRDYELLRITGPVPEDILGDVAVMTAAINDAPLDELDLEDEVFPPERIRAYENATIARGERLHRLLVRHRTSGELAGHTIVAVEQERPTIGHQHDTSVVREHRGHRLGLRLKAGMLTWLADIEPQLESIDTWNAESNDHMIGVNERLGYRVLGRALQFQRSL
jgi:GNAT superfamily N-acetyltransferase